MSGWRANANPPKHNEAMTKVRAAKATHEKTTNQDHSTMVQGATTEQETKNNTRQSHPYVGTFGPVRFHLYLASALEKALVDRVGRNSPHVDHYRWVLSSILFSQITDKRYTRACFVPLNKAALCTIISKRKATTIIAELRAWGFIEQQRSWMPGVRSMGYRLAEPYRHCKIEALPLRDRGINKRLTRFLTRKQQMIGDNGSGYAITQAWLHHLRIDRLRAMRFIRKRYDLYSDQYQARFVSIDLLANRQFFFTVDSKAGRAHHNLTNLASDLRRFINLNGRQLQQVDISNSQPIFLHLTISATHMVDPIEKEQMQDLVSRGVFYDELKPPERDRDEFKKAVFRDVFYGPDTYTTSTSARFAERFPSYAAAIRQLKQPDYAGLAVAMQTKEAEVVFKAVERFVQLAGRRAPILTIHDSLVTDEAHVGLAREALIDAFRAVHAFLPPLKEKLL